MSIFDTVVIGGGPAGLTAALYLARSGLSVAVVEKLAAGGQLLLTAAIENYPGFPDGVKGYELADLMEAHLAPYGVTRIRDAVLDVQDAAGEVKTLVLEEKGPIKTRSFIICSGAKPRTLDIPGEKELTGKGVSYCALCDGNFFRGQDVVVAGGGNSALEEALYLSRIVRKLYIVHRRDAFRGAQIYVDKIKAIDNIELVLSSVVTGLQGESGLEGVVVSHVTTGEKRTLSAQGLFVFVGFLPTEAPFLNSIARDTAGFILTDAAMRTNVPGIFAAGDIRAKTCRQVTTAVGDGATAATSAHSYLENPNA